MNLLNSNSEVDAESGAVIVKRNRKPDRKDKKIAELEQRVSYLEQRVASLSRTARNRGRRIKRYALRK